jgi:hypothetical protein
LRPLRPPEPGRSLSRQISNHLKNSRSRFRIVNHSFTPAGFEINDAAAERSDDGIFDDLLAKAVVHHAASASGLPVPPRTVALAPETAIESWAPTKAVGVNIEVLEWLAGQMRGKRRSNRTLMTLVATIVGAATTLPLTQLPNVFDIGM